MGRSGNHGGPGVAGEPGERGLRGKKPLPTLVPQKILKSLTQDLEKVDLKLIKRCQFMTSNQSYEVLGYIL